MKAFCSRENTDKRDANQIQTWEKFIRWIYERIAAPMSTASRPAGLGCSVRDFVRGKRPQMPLCTRGSAFSHNIGRAYVIVERRGDCSHPRPPRWRHDGRPTKTARFGAS